MARSARRGGVRLTVVERLAMDASASSPGLHTPISRLDRIAYRGAKANTGEVHICRASLIGYRKPKAAGRLIDARIDRVLAQEADDHLGVKVPELHQIVHVLVLFVRYVRHRGVKLGQRRHHAITEPN